MHCNDLAEPADDQPVMLQSCGVRAEVSCIDAIQHRLNQRLFQPVRGCRRHYQVWRGFRHFAHGGMQGAQVHQRPGWWGDYGATSRAYRTGSEVGGETNSISSAASDMLPQLVDPDSRDVHRPGPNSARFSTLISAPFQNMLGPGSVRKIIPDLGVSTSTSRARRSRRRCKYNRSISIIRPRASNDPRSVTRISHPCGRMKLMNSSGSADFMTSLDHMASPHRVYYASLRLVYPCLRWWPTLTMRIWQIYAFWRSRFRYQASFINPSPDCFTLVAVVEIRRPRLPVMTVGHRSPTPGPACQKCIGEAPICCQHSHPA